MSSTSLGAGGVGGRNDPSFGGTAMRSSSLLAQIRPRLDEWLAMQKRLLQRERDEEIAQRNDRLVADEINGGREMAGKKRRPRRSGAVFPLDVAELTVGFFGRTVCRLQRYGGKAVRKDGETFPRLPANSLSPGDIVMLRPVGSVLSVAATGAAEAPFPSGVVKRVRDQSVTIIFDTDAEALHDDIFRGNPGPLRLDMLGNEVTFKRLTSAMHELSTAARDANHPAARLISVATGTLSSSSSPSPLHTSSPPGSSSIRYFAPLNESQRQAVATALSTRDFCVIHGPPGTGKTTTVVELIRQLVHRGDRVLAVAPSNIAVDNLAECLATAAPGQERPLRLLRVGHPARITPAVLENTLEAVTSRGDESLVVADIQKELNDHFAQLSARDKRTGRFVASRQSRRRVYKETKILRKELRQWEDKARARAFGNADVVFATTVGIAGRAVRFNGEAPFDVVVIDEAAQALEAACWIAILKATGGRCVLAGDHCQLPPTIASDAARDAGLGTTLFDRLVNNERRLQNNEHIMLPRVENVPVCLLNVQYRMHEVISRWASHEMYHGKLHAAPEVASRTLSELPGVRNRHKCDDDGEDGEEDGKDELLMEFLEAPLVLIDTAGLSLDEVEDLESGSKANPGEAQLVVAYLSSMIIDAGVQPESIAVISPYSAQVSLLKQSLEENEDVDGESWLSRGLEIRSVDGFQGREKDLVVLSLVRSNKQKQVGFLADERRINVAVTRAKRQVVVICDSETANANAFLGRLLTHIEEDPLALSISAFELIPSLCGEDAIAMSMADGRFGESKSNKLQNITPLQRGASTSAIAMADRKSIRKAELGDFMRSLKDVWVTGTQMDNVNKNKQMGVASSLEINGSSFQAWTFPSSFSRFDRHLIHEIAEELHLCHESFGSQENGTRYIILSSANGNVAEKVPSAVAKQSESFPVKPPTSGSRVGISVDKAEMMRLSPETKAPPREVPPTLDTSASVAPSPPLQSKTPNSMLKLLAQERAARHEARLASTSQQQQQQQPAIQSGYFPHSVGSSNQTMSKNTKKKKKKKKKKKNKGKQNAGEDSSIKTSGGAVATSALDEMAYLDAMVAENQAAAKKRNKPKNWVKAEAQKWRINSDGVLSGSRGGTLTARERHDKARLLRNKIAKSQSGRGTTKTKKIQKK